MFIPAINLYFFFKQWNVQLSRVRTLEGLSIMREFDASELSVPPSDALLAELDWEREKYAQTLSRYPE